MLLFWKFHCYFCIHFSFPLTYNPYNFVLTGVLLCYSRQATVNPYTSQKAAGLRRKKKRWSQSKDMLFNSGSDISEKLTHLLSYLLAWPPYSSFSDCLQGYLLFEYHYKSQVCSGLCQMIYPWVLILTRHCFFPAMCSGS